jgi:uncharacterized damage-inducible protein DinB
MNTADVLLQFDFNRWANAKVLDAVAVLSNEQFTKELGSSYSSVRDTLTHILSAEEVWFMRWKGISPKSMLDPAYFPDVRSLQSKWAEVELDQWNFVSKLSDESLQESVEYQNFKEETWEYALWQMIHQMVSHSTYHRGQVAAMLRQLGAVPPPVDFLIYVDTKRAEKAHQSEAKS